MSKERSEAAMHAARGATIVAGAFAASSAIRGVPEVVLAISTSFVSSFDALSLISFAGEAVAFLATLALFVLAFRAIARPRDHEVPWVVVVLTAVAAVVMMLVSTGASTVSTMAIYQTMDELAASSDRPIGDQIADWQMRRMYMSYAFMLTNMLFLVSSLIAAAMLWSRHARAGDGTSMR